MYALKLELKLNNKERSRLAGCAGFKRVVYNFGLELVKQSWSFDDIKASDARRIDTAKKILTNQVMKLPEYGWMKSYPSTVYQSALQDLKDAFSRWRQGLAHMAVFKAKNLETVSQSIKLAELIQKRANQLCHSPTNKCFSQGGKLIYQD